MKRKKKRLSPRAWQVLIWAVAVGMCLVFAVTFGPVGGRRGPVLPELKAAPVSPSLLQDGPDSAQRPTEAASPPVATAGAHPAPPPAEAGPRQPQRLTEALFVQISAEMLVASDAFGTSEVAQRSFERACEGILERHRVTRKDFEWMQAEIASDPQRQADVVDRVLEEADRMRLPTDVRVEVRPGPTVDPRHPPPPARRPATPTR